MWKKIAKPLFRIILIMVISASVVHAQNDPWYLIFFTDKQGTPYHVDQPSAFLTERAIERRSRQNIPIVETDLPVNPAYVEAVRLTGAQVLHTTKWFNGVIVQASDSQLEQIQAMPFFKGIERNLPVSQPNGRKATKSKFSTEQTIDYGNSARQLEMLGVPNLHQLGFSGEGMLIGVFDAGFSRANEVAYLQHLFANGKILDTYDFISRHSNVYDDHRHGLQVLSVMASYGEGQLVGPAYNAHYVLYRTEDDTRESPYEEVTWLLAAERADSLGVDVINTSLGYYDFDNAAYNYTYEQMDGKTTLISRAARMAARTGILLVVSAGNEGNNNWKHITAPADVDSVLTVGAITSTGDRATFSSVGPNAIGQIKPDVVALGSGVRVGSVTGSVTTSNGTSFASPLIASFATLLWQLFPEKTAQEIADFVRNLGNQAENPDFELGYGLPFFKVNEFLASPENLTAELDGNYVQLRWDFPHADEEITFIVERAYEEQDFEVIAMTTDNELISDTLTQGGSYRYRVKATSGQLYSEYSSVQVVQFFILGKEPNVGAIHFWPNPAQDKLTIESPGRGSWELNIFNSMGSCVQKTALTILADGRAEVSVKNLPNGLYLLQLIGSRGELTVQKFIKH